MGNHYNPVPTRQWINFNKYLVITGKHEINSGKSLHSVAVYCRRFPSFFLFRVQVGRTLISHTSHNWFYMKAVILLPSGFPRSRSNFHRTENMLVCSVSDTNGKFARHVFFHQNGLMISFPFSLRRAFNSFLSCKHCSQHALLEPSALGLQSPKFRFLGMDRFFPNKNTGVLSCGTSIFFASPLSSAIHKVVSSDR